MRSRPFTVGAEDDDTRARAGLLHCRSGDVPTPAFMPVATAGSVKTLSPGDLRTVGNGALIANALLLSLRPGGDAVRSAGGLGRYMGYGGVVFTDSGGFQIIRGRFKPRLDDDGIEFNDPYEGSRVKVTPEGIAATQRELGSDVAMVLDDCAPYPYTPERLQLGMERTLEWARRCKDAWDASGHEGEDPNGKMGALDFVKAAGNGDNPPGRAEGRPAMLFAIVQGGVDPELRRTCASRLADMGFDGFGIGGLSIGEPREEMLRAVKWSVEPLPPDSPRYLMGVGSPPEILEAVERGVDVFDSVYPTRNARHGTAFVPGGTMDLRRNRWAGVKSPLQADCPCPACSELTTGYLHHLFRIKEISGMRLLSIHNLTFLQRYVTALRSAIAEGEFGNFRSGIQKAWAHGEGVPGAEVGWG